MTQKKEAAIVVPVMIPIDQERFQMRWERAWEGMKKFFTLDKQKRIKNKVEKSVKKFMKSDPQVKVQVKKFMDIYLDSFYDRVLPKLWELEGRYKEGDYYDFLIGTAALYTETMVPLVQSIDNGLNRVSAWMQAVYENAYRHYANEYGLQEQKQQQQELQPATASVGYKLAALDPQPDFQLRTAFIIPFPMIMIVDDDDPVYSEVFKTGEPAVAPILRLLGKAVKKRLKKRKERIEEKNVMRLAANWARKKVNENSATKSVAEKVKKQFIDPFLQYKGNFKEAQYKYKKGDWYEAVRQIAEAYQLMFYPAGSDISELTQAMNKASAIYQAHMTHFANYVAQGGTLPKLASAQVVVGGAVYRRTTAAQKAHPIFRWIWEDVMDSFGQWFAEHRYTGKDEEYGPAIEEAAKAWLNHVEEVVRVAVEQEDNKIVSKLDEGDALLSKLSELLLHLAPLGKNPTKEQVVEQLKEIRNQNAKQALGRPLEK